MNVPTSAIVSSPDYNAYVDRKAAEGDSIMSMGISVLYKFMNLFSDLAQGKYDQMSAKADRARDSQQAANQVDYVVSQIKDAGGTGDLPQNVIDYLREHNISITMQNDGKNASSGIGDYLKSIKGTDKSTGKGLSKTQLEEIRAAAKAALFEGAGELTAKLVEGSFLGPLDSAISKIKGTGDTADVPEKVLEFLANSPIKIKDDKCIGNYLKSLSDEGKGLNKGQLDVIKAALETDAGRCSDFVTQSQLQIQKTMQSYNVCVSLINSMQSLLAEMNKSIAQNIR